MKRILSFTIGAIAMLLAIAGCQMVRNSGDVLVPEPTSEKLRLATYNVHYIIMNKEAGPWSLGDWERRKGSLDLAFKEIGADVIAFQEMESFAGRSGSDVNLTLDWLLERNSNYATAAVGNVADFPSTQPILYRKDRLEALDQGWFFFSETPEVIYSRTFNGSYPAYASWASFRVLQDDSQFRVVNIHTDYASRSNRMLSIDLVADWIEPWAAAGETVFIVGDLNARHGSKIIRVLEDVGVRFAPTKGATYHFNRGLNLFGAIDHIGVVGKSRIADDPIVLRRRFEDEWPTDHYPVIADFNL